MNFHTPRLWIRDPSLDDLAGVYPFLSDPQVMRSSHFGPEPYTWQQARAWLEEQIFHNQQNPRFSHNSLLIERQSQHILGTLGIGLPADTSFGDLDFGYSLRRDCWGRGYMTEALRGMLAFAFEHLGASTIFGECAAANAASSRVMAKAGMQPTSAYVEAHPVTAEPVAMLRYTITRQAWLSQNPPASQKG